MSQPIAHGGGLAAAAARYGGRIEDWLDLSTGINPCPLPLPIIEDRVWNRLPDRELETAARLAAQVFYRSGSRLPLPVSGTQSVIQLLPRLAPSGRPVAVMSPTYGEYSRVMAMAGFTVAPVSSLDEVNERHGLVVVVNPNNPDGRRFEPSALLKAAERLAGGGGWLVVDEAFGDCEPQGSVAAGTADNLIVFRSFGKFFGMAGIRLGFVIAADNVLDRFSDWLGPWAVSGPALAVAKGLFQGDVRVIEERIGARFSALSAVLGNAGLSLAGGAGLFALVEDPDAADLHDHLCQARILTRKFDYAPAWLRFGLAPDGEGDLRLARALASWRRPS